MGRKALHGEPMTPAERQAKRRTGRQLTVANCQQSIEDIRAMIDKRIVDNELWQQIDEQLSFIEQELPHLA